MEEIESRGAKFIGEKYVCAACIEDYALKEVVRQSADHWRCDYCGGNRRSAPVDDLIEVIVEALRTEYDDPANELGWDSAEGGYLGEVIDTGDLVWECEITENEELADDVTAAIVNEIWCRRDYYSLPREKRLAYGWRELCDIVKHENHFFPTRRGRSKRYLDPDSIEPEELMRSLTEIIDELGLVRRLPKGTRFSRARVHRPDRVLRTASELGPPSREQAYIPNRMSPAGVPMFYGAHIKTALAEVDYPASGKAATTASFETTLPINVVDLSSLPKLPSLFDLERNHLRSSALFIRDFVADLSKPIVKDNRQHVEYVPTQYATAYMQNRMPGRIMGIVYPSSKTPSGGVSCVLFFNDEECREPEAHSETRQYLKLLPQSIRRFPAI